VSERTTSRCAALPVTIAPGMLIYETWSSTRASVVAFTQAYCIYRANGTSELSVAPWHELALANICPADPLPPQYIAETDLANARAALLREFLAAKSFGLTASQAVALDELIELLCGAQQS
jgi:hypothetical protein